jgi:hypothetical protein
MVKKRKRGKVLPVIMEDSVRRINRLIPDRRFESPWARSDKLAIACLNKVFGPDWVSRHITASKKDEFLSCNDSTPEVRETRRMRRIMLAEMLYNLKIAKGFNSCIEKLYTGQVESTYAALEIARLLVTLALDKGLSFRFVPESKKKRRDYDLSVKCSDGVAFRAETKCKLEETKITLRTIEQTLSLSKMQLPTTTPGIIFVKVPRHWIEDEKFTIEMRKLAQRFLKRSSSIVSVKFYTSSIVYHEDNQGQTVGEVVAVREETNDNHRFGKLRGRNWHMFPTTGPAAPPAQMNYNGMPSSWKRLIVSASNQL